MVGALQCVVEQQDLGIWAHCSLKVASHVDTVVDKSLGSLAFIGQGAKYRNCFNMSQLYKMLVSLHLEYYVQFWSPCYGEDGVKLGRGV